jgi:hypothetical protein
LTTTTEQLEAARGLVDKLVELEGLETRDASAVAAQIAELLARFEARTDEAIASARGASGKFLERRDHFEDTARAGGFFWGEDALVGLRPDIVSTLESSEHVEELFADDATLERVVTLSLLEHVSIVERRRLAALGEGCAVRSLAASRPPTLADLGYAFPLWDAPREDACLDEPGGCRVCNQWVDVRFRGACYACFRAGNADAAMDTELGLVRPEDAASGITLGVPARKNLDARRTQALPARRDGRERRVAFRVAPEWLFELVRTPQYSTWQGERWLFCCGRPMIYLGAADRDALDAWAVEAKGALEDVVRSLHAPHAIDAEEMVDDVLRGAVGLYVFRCPACETKRGHSDRT